jgi:hypothetical protein
LIERLSVTTSAIIAIIVKQIGCQLILKKDTNKVAKVAKVAKEASTAILLAEH